MSMKYIRDTYGVPAKRGMSVKIAGRRGTIVKSRGQYLLVRWEDTVGRACVPCHPTWQAKYLVGSVWHVFDALSIDDHDEAPHA